MGMRLILVVGRLFDASSSSSIYRGFRPLTKRAEVCGPGISFLRPPHLNFFFLSVFSFSGLESLPFSGLIFFVVYVGWCLFVASSVFCRCSSFSCMPRFFFFFVFFFFFLRPCGRRVRRCTRMGDNMSSITSPIHHLCLFTSPLASSSCASDGLRLLIHDSPPPLRPPSAAHHICNHPPSSAINSCHNIPHSSTTPITLVSLSLNSISSP
jgi:hypothetical protein